MTRLTLWLVAWLVPCFLYAQTTIQSTTAGGNWSQGSTWVGGVVPTAGDDVIINGLVKVGINVECNNLTVNDSLTNDGAGCWSNRHITIHGTLTNNGYLGNEPHYYCSGLRLNLEGDLINQGDFYLYHLYLQGSQIQTLSTTTNNFLSAGSGIIIEKTGGQVKAGSDLYLATPLDLDEKVELDMQNHDLHLQGNGRVIKGQLNQVAGIYFGVGTSMGRSGEPFNMIGTDIHFYGSAYLGGDNHGNHRIQGNLTIHDTLTNNGDGCYNPGERHLVVHGNLTNKGIILNSSHYYCGGLILEVTGNLDNQGDFEVKDLVLSGTQQQTLSTANGKYLYATNGIALDKTGGQLRAGSDLYLATTLNLDNQVDLDMQQFALYLKGNGRPLKGLVSQTADVYFDEGAHMGDYNEAITLKGSDIHFYGKAIWGSSTSYDHIVDGNLIIHDTLTSDGTSCNYPDSRHLIVKGHLTNNGVITSDPHYYCSGLKIMIEGSLFNHGEFIPHTAYLSGTGTQLLSMSPNAIMAPEYRLYGAKSSGSIRLSSDFTCNTEFILDKQAPLDVQGHSLYLGPRGVIREGYLENVKNVYCEGNGALGGNVGFTPGDTTWIAGDTIRFFGNSGLYSDVIIDAVVVVEDTLINKSGGKVNVNFLQDVINRGTIINRTYSYMLFNQYLHASAYNYGTWGVQTMGFMGNAHRTAQLRDITYSWIGYYDTLHLVGENSLPRVYAASGNADGKLWIHADASLETAGFSPDRLMNEGFIHWQKDIDPTKEQTVDFYRVKLRNKAGCIGDQWRVETHESSVAPGAASTVLRWWKVSNTPFTFNDSLAYLRFDYKDAQLDTHHPDSLKVFFSDNAGLSWIPWTDVYHSTYNDYLEAYNVPGPGWYALSGTDIGISRVRPSLDRIESNVGGQSNFTAFVYGSGFTPETKVWLENTTHGQVQPDTIEVHPLGHQIAMTMLLTQAALGTYDVVVDIPGDTLMTLPGAFTVVPKEAPEPFVHLTGREAVMLGRFQTYTITYGNTGNIDARAVPIYLTISETSNLEVEFLDFDVPISDYAIQQGYQSALDTLSIYLTADTAFMDHGQVRVYPLYIPRIPANSVQSVRFRVKSDQSFKMQLAMQDPLFVNPFDPACVLGVIGEGVIDITTAAIPGVGCAVAAGKTAFKQTDKYLETGKKSWGSWIYDWTVVGLDCAVNLSGIGGFAKATAIFFINMYNYKTAFDECRPKPIRDRDVRQFVSADPNAKEGPGGFGAENYISYPDEMPYVIYFENKPSATAPAQTVHIADTLDPAVYDFTTFQFGGVQFGDRALNLLLGHSDTFERLVDLRPEKDIVLQIKGKFDKGSGIAQWDFTSIDPLTGELTEDPFGGFLPPNLNSPEGEGSVTFFIKPKGNLPHNTVIDNRASIVFDVNAPILTNTYRNRLDLQAPSSQIDQHTAVNDTTLHLTWSGIDDGSGIQTYTLQVKEGDQTTYAMSFTGDQQDLYFTGQLDSTYQFWLVAEDSVGNVEDLSPQPDVTITLKATGISIEKDRLISVYPNPVAHGQLSIQSAYPFQAPAYIEILTLDGKPALQQVLPLPATFSVKSLSAGLYVVRIRLDDYTYLKKIVIAQ